MSEEALKKSLALNADHYETFIESPFRAIIARYADEMAELARVAIVNQAQTASIDPQKCAYYGARLTILEEIRDGSFWRDAYKGANARLRSQFASDEATRKHYDQAIDPGSGPAGAPRRDADGSDEEWPVGPGYE